MGQYRRSQAQAVCDPIYREDLLGQCYSKIAQSHKPRAFQLLHFSLKIKKSIFIAREFSSILDYGCGTFHEIT